MPLAALMPGIAPTSIPSEMPTTSISRFMGIAAVINPCQKKCTVSN
jgi:hypothetical protein